MSNFKVFVGDNNNQAKYVGQILDDTTLTQLNNKQDALVSGTNIKTINNNSLLGSGNITISGSGTTDYNDLSNKPSINGITLSGDKTASDLGLSTTSDLNNKVDKISTANIVYGVDPDGNQSSYEVSTSAVVSTIVRRTTAGQVSVAQTPTSNVHATSKKYVDDGLGTKQDTLVSGTNIKTVNGTSILGNGNLAISEVASQSSGTIKFWTGTQTQYDAITTKDATTLYIVIPAS